MTASARATWLATTALLITALCTAGLRADESSSGSWKPQWLPSKKAAPPASSWTGSTSNTTEPRSASRFSSADAASQRETAQYQRTGSRFAPPGERTVERMIERTGGEQRRPSRDERLSADSGSSRSSLVIKTAANDPAPAPRGSRYAAPAQRMVTTERRGSPFRQQEPMLESEDQLVMAQQPIGQPADMPPAFERSPEARLNIDCEAERQKLKPIDAITNNIAAEPGEFPPECENPEDRFQPRNWSATTYTWKASGLCHKPLYFEDWNLERYGHAMPPGIQQVSSAAHFLGAGALLPYKMAMDPPWECQYTLGYFRPSSCAPWMIRPFPASGRGGIAEAAAVTGLIFLIP